MRGFVSLVGVGPGDPGLLTLRGRDAIARADTVLFDALVHPGVLRHARPDAEQLFVGKRGDRPSTSQDEINHVLLLRAGQGRRVARLKGGDALVFGRGAEEAEFLADHGVAFEIVPGVSAALGATTYAGIPLTHRELASSVALVTSRERPGKASQVSPLSAVAGADTVVVFMGLARLADDLATLVASGRAPSTPAAVISVGTHPEQRVITGTIADLAGRVAAAADLRSPALVVIGDVVTLRERLAWWDRPGLHGRRVLVARSAEQSPATADALVAEGAVALEVPLLRFEAPTNEAAVAAALDGLVGGRFDVTAFTSVNGVARAFDALLARGFDARALARCEVVAVGPETARALRERGIVADAVAVEHHGAALAEAIVTLRGDRAVGSRVLLARAEVAGDELPRRLRDAGATVTDLALYRTAGPGDDERQRVRALWPEVDAVLLTSGSIARHLVEALDGALDPANSRVVFASIGPSTSAAARAAGLPVHVEAVEHTVDGLLAALRDHYRQGAPSPP